MPERPRQRLAQLPLDEHLDFGSGRLEQRTGYVETRLELLDGLAEWTHLKSVIRVDSGREMQGQTVRQTRYCLSHLAAVPAAFNRYVRQHWSIENRLHWTLAVVFREDRQRVRQENGPLNRATARKLALQGARPARRRTQLEEST